MQRGGLSSVKSPILDKNIPAQLEMIKGIGMGFLCAPELSFITLMRKRWRTTLMKLADKK